MASALRRDINVTPLVDIVLVLLIVFIVVAPAVDSAVRLPVSKHARKASPAPAPRISLRREGRHARASVEMPGQPAKAYRFGDGSGDAALSAEVARLLAGDSEKSVQVKADAGLSNALVGQLLQACRAGGALRATFATGEDPAANPGRL